MKACRTLVLLASLALVLGASAAAACSAEVTCVDSTCAEAYGAPDQGEFPFSVDYTTTGDSVSTTFHFKVCSTACVAADPLCKSLKAFRLRLNDEVLASPAKFIKMANPEGSVSATCAAAGPGWFIKDAELLSLATNNPAQGETCEVFSISVYNPTGAVQPMFLSELCQQGVKIVSEEGDDVFTQEGASCLYTLELSSGVSGVGQLDQRSPSPPPVPSPRPSPPSPTPTPSPSPRPVPHPSPKPHPYYSGSSHHRRLQQAPFVRNLLSYYSDGRPSTHHHDDHHNEHDHHHHRHLSGEQAVAEPLAFATRRLMEASAVPLPTHLSSTRRLQHAGHHHGGHHGDRAPVAHYYGAGHHHRRLQHAGHDHDGHHGDRAPAAHYYGAGHHRRLQHAGHHHDGHGDRAPVAHYYGAHHHRRLASFDGQAAATGRSLLHGGYYHGGSSHRHHL